MQWLLIVLLISSLALLVAGAGLGLHVYRQRQRLHAEQQAEHLAEQAALDKREFR